MITPVLTKILFFIIILFVIRVCTIWYTNTAAAAAARTKVVLPIIYSMMNNYLYVRANTRRIIVVQRFSKRIFDTHTDLHCFPHRTIFPSSLYVVSTENASANSRRSVKIRLRFNYNNILSVEMVSNF